jgi:predicted ATPase
MISETRTRPADESTAGDDGTAGATTGSARGAPETTPPRWPTAAPPATTGRFLDRDAEWGELADALEADGERVLVTLVGPAGAGKTRLANEMALAQLAEREGRVAWVALGGVADASVAAAAIAAALALPETPGDEVLSAVARRLAAETPRPAGEAGPDAPRRPPLLVLDALAQLVPNVAWIDEMRTAAPGLAILVTSRRPLRLAGEVTIEVGPLAVPAPDADPAEVAESPAVRLLVGQAAERGAGVEVTPANASTLARLAERLDGLPLALELAGGALRRLSPRQLLDRLSAPQGGQTSPVLDTLGATLDRSAELVSMPAQVVFRRLSVFIGPIDLDLAQSVIERGELLGLSAPEVDVATAIDELVEASLLRWEAPAETGEAGTAGPATRAVMLETVRAHARERLAATTELMTAEWAHAHEVLERVELLDRRLSPMVDERALAALDRLAPETAAALDRAAAHGGDDVLLRLSAALSEWWRIRGKLTEGRLRLELALRRTADRRDGARARALYGAASLAYRQGDFVHARARLEEAISLLIELGDRAREARARNLLGLVAFDEGRMDEALELGRSGLAIRRELDDPAELASSLNSLGGMHHFRGELDEARAALDESLAIREGFGDEGGVAVCLANLALIDRDVGELDAAVDRLEAALVTRRRLGDRVRQAVTVHNLGLVRLEQGRLDDARAAIEEALAIAREVGDRVEIGNALADLSLIARDDGRIGDAWQLAVEAVSLASRIGARGVLAIGVEATAALAGGEDPPDGARLWAAAGALRVRTGYALLHADRRRLLREIDDAQSRADPAVWARAWEEGERLDDMAVAALALERAGAPVQR